MSSYTDSFLQKYDFGGGAPTGSYLNISGKLTAA